MDLFDQADSLIEIQRDKLNYASILNAEVVNVNTNQQLKRIEISPQEEIKESLADVQEKKSKQKIRKRNPENWKQNVRKRNKNKGLEYIKVNGKVCEKKKLGPPCSCKEKCYLKIGVAACEKIFQNFWKLGDHTLQNAYIAGCVRIFLPKHCYKKDGIPSRRFFSRNFHVTVNGVDTEVCKQAFLNMHGVSNGRLDRLLKKKQEIGNTGFDARGRHNNKVNKIPLEKIQLVRKHIDSVRQKAGYTGKRKPKKVELLPGVLNIRTMYRSYKEEMLLKGLEPVCEYRYRKIFHTDYHLEFGKMTAANEAIPNCKNLQATRQMQETMTYLPQCYLPERKICLQSSNFRKSETSPSVTLKDLNLCAQINVGPNNNKDILSHQQLGVQITKDFQLKPVESTLHPVAQDIFRLDCPSTYSAAPQNWTFTNPT